MRKKRNGVRASGVFFCTTLLLTIMLLVVITSTDKNYRDLLEVNDQLMQTIEKNRSTYNSNLEQVREQSSEYLKKYSGEHGLRMSLEKKLNSGLSEYTYEEVYLLAQCVQAEAGYPDKHSNSQKMICQVILNRVDSTNFPDTIKEVIYQKDHGIQFSVAYNGALESQDVQPETLNNVYKVLMFGCDIPHEVQYFYSASLKEANWVKTLKIYDTVEGTVFSYSK